MIRFWRYTPIPFLLLAVVLASSSRALPQVVAPAVEQKLYAFPANVNDAIEPYAGVVMDKTGAIYGTAYGGGGGPCQCGAVYKLTPNGKGGYTESVIYAFTGYKTGDGQDPQSTLIVDDTGALYGTTSGGGIDKGAACFNSGCGTVFKLSPSASGYIETVLYRFTGGNDGSTPVTGVVKGKNGTLIGTTLYAGGSQECVLGCGTAFELIPSGSGYVEKVIHRFQGSNADGGHPAGNLTPAPKGVLLGTTAEGGTGCARAGCGTVYALLPTNSRRPGSLYEERIIYSFQNGQDGGGPEAGLTAGPGGAFYGTTSGGGGTFCNSGTGCGTVFKLAQSGKAYAESVLYRFAEPSNPNDGIFPDGGLVLDSSGSLYGTTYGSIGHVINDDGTIYKLRPLSSGRYHETILHSFRGSLDGAFPYSTLILDPHGILYGTTSLGGGANGCNGAASHGCGVVFQVSTPHGI